MLTEALPDLKAWVDFFSHAEMPILRLTARRLVEARKNIDKLNARQIAAIVLHDPLMAVRVLAYIQAFKGKKLHSEITTIGNAIMMLGVEPFFNRFEAPVTIESMLKNEPQALMGVVQVIRRVQRASQYANEWARERRDLDVEEVSLAALLHDLSEILLWCFAPKLAVEIKTRQRADRNLRSAIAQQKVLGIRLSDLQLTLCDAWQLPELMKKLLDGQNTHVPRVQNVKLAVDLARHSAESWDNPALRDDFTAICALLRISRETLLSRLEVPDELLENYLTQSQIMSQDMLSVFREATGR